MGKELRESRARGQRRDSRNSLPINLRSSVVLAKYNFVESC